MTPAPLAMTSPSSTARPGEKCFHEDARRNMERPALSPCRRLTAYGDLPYTGIEGQQPPMIPESQQLTLALA